MSIRDNFSRIWPLHLLVIFFTLHGPALAIDESAAPVPQSLLGTWQVTKVNIDTGSSRTRNIQYNDPRDKGRLLTISPDKLAWNTSVPDLCEGPMITHKRMTAGVLIKKSMAGRGLPPETPTPEDYELPLADEAPVDVLSVSCKGRVWGASLGRAGGIRGAWMVVLPTGQLALRSYDETILILNRLPENAKPVASFDCNKAKIPSEKTICRSLSLASFDKSIAEAYANATLDLENDRNVPGWVRSANVEKLKAAQKAWLAKRNTCGADAGCLQKSMEDRLEAFAHPENFED